MSVIATGLKKSPCIFKYICIIRIRQSGTIFDACSGRRYRTVVVTVFDTVVFVTPYSYLFARSYVLNSTTPPPDHGPARFQRLLKDDWLAEWVGGRPYRSNHVKVLWEEERGAERDSGMTFSKISRFRSARGYLFRRNRRRSTRRSRISRDVNKVFTVTRFSRGTFLITGRRDVETTTGVGCDGVMEVMGRRNE